MINRMGFNNGGMEAAARNLARAARQRASSASISAPTRTAPTASPITRRASRGWRRWPIMSRSMSRRPTRRACAGLQNRDELTRLLAALTEARAQKRCHSPLLLKIAPDLDEHALDEIADVVAGKRHRRPDRLQHHHRAAAAAKRRMRARRAACPASRCSRPRPKSCARCARGCRQGIVLIGVGGIASRRRRLCQDPRRRQPGAALYRAGLSGPGLVARIKRELLACLARDGFRSVADAVGPSDA